MTPLKKFALAGALLIVAVCIHALVVGNTLAEEWELLATLLSLTPIAMFGPNVRDAQYKATLALPAAPGTVTQAAGFDLETGPAADFLATCEFLITAPAVTTTMLPNGITNTYNVVAANNPALTSPTVIQSAVLVQTGAGGVGAPLATARTRIPTNLGALGFRYIGLQATSAATAGNESTVSATFEGLF